MRWVSAGLAMTAVVLLSAVGCGKATSTTPHATLPPGNVSGSRLRAEYTEVGGVRAPTRSWFDTELGVSCSFIESPEGHLCQPPDASLEYTDPECTQPVLVVAERWLPDPEPGLPVTLRRPNDASCAPNVAVVKRLGSERTGLTQTYAGDGCVAADLAEGQRVFEVGDELSLSRLVAASSQEVELDERFGYLALYANDGAVQPDRLYDHVLNTDAGIGVSKVVPHDPSYVFTDALSDASCEHAISSPVAVGCDAHFGYEPSGEDCKADLIIWRLGAPAPQDVFLGTPDNCLSWSTSADPTFELAQRVEPDEMTSHRLTTVGDARIRAAYYQAVDTGTLLQWAGWYDAKLDTLCTPATLADGQERCVPRFAAVGRYFIDAECKLPAANTSECAAPKFLAMSGSGVTQYFELGQEQDVGQAYELRQGDCVASSEIAGRLLVARRAMAPSEFELASEGTE